MQRLRSWATPLTAGAFLLCAVTGVLMFFHLDSGYNKPAHEWFSWALLGGVLLHATTNAASLGRHLGAWKGRLLVGAFALVLALSFWRDGQPREAPPYLASMQALAALPLSQLAPLAHLSLPALRERLVAAGVPEAAQATDDQTLAGLVGSDRRRQIRTLGRVFQPA